MMKVDISKLPSGLFWRGQLVRDVPKIRLLSVQERKESGRRQPDIEVKSMIHGTYRVYRKAVSDTFNDTLGRPIKVSRLHTNKSYQTVVHITPPVDIAFLKPSTKFQYTLNGKTLNNTKYLIFSLSADGNVLIQDVKVVTKKVFEKAVHVTDSFEAVQKRLERTEASKDNPANDYLLGDCRIVAKATSKKDYSTLGYVIGYINERGANDETLLPLNKVRTLIRERRVRNVTQDFRMTYGDFNQLPTYYVD